MLPLRILPILAAFAGPALVPALAQAPATAPAQPDAQPKTGLDPKQLTTQLAPEVAEFIVREGFEVTLAVPGPDNARFMEVGTDGTLYVSRPRFSDILALRDTDGDGIYENAQQFVEDMPAVHGLSWHDGYLWFSTTSAIYRAADNDKSGMADTVEEIIAGLPGEGSHWWRSILVTDDHIFTSVGDSGNITDERATDRQKIWRFSKTGSDKTLWSTGIRNTEKLRLRPGTTELWGVDHGSDMFGDTLGEDRGVNQPFTDAFPPDELNRYDQNAFYGHPFLVGDRIPRPEFREHAELLELAGKTVVPQWRFAPHSAANSFTFIDPAINAKSKALPADFEGDMIVAQRGSWNRTTPSGYAIVRVMFDKDAKLGGSPMGEQTLVKTVVQDPEGPRVLARPVDCVQAPDGSILFSTDLPKGRIYRIRYVGK
jgi:glucose/arabinose dehydrogenase